MARCPRDSGWCDGTTCREIGFMHCPNAEPETTSRLRGLYAVREEVQGGRVLFLLRKFGPGRPNAELESEDQSNNRRPRAMATNDASQFMYDLSEMDAITDLGMALIEQGHSVSITWGRSGERTFSLRLTDETRDVATVVVPPDDGPDRADRARRAVRGLALARNLELPSEDSTPEDPSIYPREEGDTIILGPGVFVAKDRRVLNWRGVNYVRQDSHA